MKSLKGILVLAVLTTGMLIPSSALAVEAAEEAVPNRTAKSKTNIACEPTKGNPELEHAKKETPPPEGPNGEAVTPPSGESPCPAGTLGVTKPENRPAKHTGPFAQGVAPSGGGSASTGYFYVGDSWECKCTAVQFFTEFSSPVVPTNAIEEAHTVSQLLISKNGLHYTLEMGWIKELKDQQAGYKGAALFFYVNPDSYGPLSCYNCGLVLASGITESPFGKHYYATDGTPGSYCVEQGSPCRGFTWMVVRQYKGAWWLWWNKQWVGRISDNAWGKHFTKGEEAQGYGEVYDHPNAPVTPMGNGNKGGCTCATAVQSLTLGTKVVGSTEPSYKRATFHNPLEVVNWLQKYTAGNFNSAHTEMHFGG